ncbi:MAG TPA: hypothetical protein VFD76_00210 [Gemmatimonadales bacterium]|nr:hypothetical protein [Gemmatimonadales bacterium]
MRTVRLLALIALASCHLDKLLGGGNGAASKGPPGTGMLRVTAATSGSGPDSVGYTLSVDQASQGIGVNATLTLGVAAGTHAVALGRVPSNCAVGDANPRSVTVPAQDTARTTFSVACSLPATHYTFLTQPHSPQESLQPFQVQVAALDDSGNVVPSFTDSLTIAIGTDGSLTQNATLSGTKRVKAVNGIATFSDLSIDQPGTGYTLTASGPKLPAVTSSPFDVL